jgi:hypothetical protein
MSCASGSRCRRRSSVLALHLERESPLPREQVAFDYDVAERLRETRRIRIELLIAQRHRLDELRALVEAWGLRVARIGVAESDGTVTGDFTATSLRRGRQSLTVLERRLAASATALAALALLGVVALWGYERLWIGRELATARAGAQAAAQMQAQLQRAQAPLVALREITAATDAAEALAALTPAVPGAAWLFEIDIAAPPGETPRAKMLGFAPNGRTLVETLQVSPSLAEVTLRASRRGEVFADRELVELEARWQSPAGPIAR